MSQANAKECLNPFDGSSQRKAEILPLQTQEIFLKRNLAHRLAKLCVPRIGSESRVPDHLRQASARPDFVHARRYPRVFRLRQGAGKWERTPGRNAYATDCHAGPGVY